MALVARHGKPSATSPGSIHSRRARCYGVFRRDRGRRHCLYDPNFVQQEEKTVVVRSLWLGRSYGFVIALLLFGYSCRIKNNTMKEQEKNHFFFHHSSRFSISLFFGFHSCTFEVLPVGIFLHSLTESLSAVFVLAARSRI